MSPGRGGRVVLPDQADRTAQRRRQPLLRFGIGERSLTAVREDRDAGQRAEDRLGSREVIPAGQAQPQPTVERDGRAQSGEPGNLPLGDGGAAFVDDEPPPVADYAPRLHGDLVMVDPVAALDRIGMEGDDVHPETLARGGRPRQRWRHDLALDRFSDDAALHDQCVTAIRVANHVFVSTTRASPSAAPARNSKYTSSTRT